MHAALLQTVSELEAQNDDHHLLGGDMIPLSMLECQICNLVSSSTLLSRGLDSPERLEGFTLDALMHEVKSLVTDLLQLFNTALLHITMIRTHTYRPQHLLIILVYAYPTIKHGTT